MNYAYFSSANIHSVEVTSGVAACFLINRLVSGYTSGESQIVEALHTRTFYIAPRVNPDGVEVPYIHLKYDPH
jgi:murein tripeptide amidase MpaA